MDPEFPLSVGVDPGLGVVSGGGETVPAVAARPQRAWLRQRERGSGLAIGSLLWATRILGRTGVLPILWLVSGYYTLFGEAAKRASTEYLGRILPDGKAGFVRRFRHIFTFVRVALDRFFLVQGRFDLFEITHTGGEHIARHVEEGSGAILVGAHLGSFEAMRAGSRARSVRLNMLVHFEQAKMINAFLGAADPEFMVRVIEIHPGQLDHVFEAKERLEAGELVGIMADRVGLGGQTIPAEFLGSTADFPSGPFSLAAALGQPVYLTFGLFEGPRSYHLHCEPFTEAVQIPRRERASTLPKLVQRYAGRLEHYCRLAPYNWFNFFDFWERAADDRSEPSPR